MDSSTYMMAFYALIAGFALLFLIAQPERLDAEGLQREIVARNTGLMISATSFLPGNIYYQSLNENDEQMLNWDSFFLGVKKDSLIYSKEESLLSSVSPNRYRYFIKNQEINVQNPSIQTGEGKLTVQKTDTLTIGSDVKKVSRVPCNEVGVNFNYFSYYAPSGFYNEDGVPAQEGYEAFVDDIKREKVSSFLGRAGSERYPPPQLERNNAVFLRVGNLPESHIIFYIPHEKFEERYNEACTLMNRFLSIDDEAYQLSIDGYTILPSYDENMILEIGSITDQYGVLNHREIINDVLYGRSEVVYG